MNQHQTPRTLCRRSAVAIGVSLLMATTVMAQSSDGSLFGRSKPGSVIVITNVETGVSRQVRAESDGSFAASKLPPGTYKVTADGVTREVAVAIGSGTEVVLDASQRVEITGARSRTLIDMSSSESNSVFTQEQIRALPVARSVDAVALLAPGTIKGDTFANEDDLKLPSFGGASVAENGYYINGLDVTNIRNFLSYAELPFDAIAQQQVKSGGYGAEYGRSLGGVISLVTKRGTNEWKGGASVIWEPSSLRSNGKDVADLDPDRAGLPAVFNSADREQKRSYVLYGGGPIIKDKLFVFGALEAHDDWDTRYRQSNSTKRTNKKPNGMLKIDWSVTDNHLLELTAIENKKELTYKDYKSNTDYSPHLDQFQGTSTRESGGSVLIGKYTGYLTDNLTVSALVGRVKDKVNTFSGYRKSLENCPVVLETDLSDIGCWVPPFPSEGSRITGFPDDNDKRDSFRLDFEYVLGKHTIRAGIDNQSFKSLDTQTDSFTGGAYFRYFFVPGSGRINGVDGFTPGAQYVRERIRQSTPGSYEVNNSAYYIEDTWKVNKQLTLYGGLRWESFENLNGDGVAFVEKKNLLAPRLGFALDLSNNGSFKVFGNAGRYYIPVASNTNIRGTRGEVAIDRFHTFTGRDPVTQAPIGMTQVGATLTTGDGAIPNPGTVADTQLKPMNQDELILGFQKAVAKDFVFGVKAIHRKINAGMDDYCDHVRVADWITANVDAGYTDNLASCMLMNPGKDLNIKVDLKNDGNLVDVRVPASALGLAKYERTYNALEFTFERPFDGRWGLAGSYTWSKSVGSAEGYVQSNLNQDDAGVTQDFDFGSFSDGSKGYLPNDRRHVFKVYGNYQLTSDFRLGFNATLASGRPLSCIGFVPPTVPDFAGAVAYPSASAYYCIKDPNQTAVLVKRGSVGRTKWTNTIDLSIAYIPQWANKKLTLVADVFNVFNNGRPTELNETRDYSRAESNSTTPPYRQNENYLQPTTFQEPRSVRLTARYEF
jgi:hypothetical protein